MDQKVASPAAEGRTISWADEVVRRLLAANRNAKRFIAIVTDILTCALAAWLSFMIRLGVWLDLSHEVILFSIFEIFLTITIFAFSGVYNNIFRFYGLRGLGQIARCCVIIAIPSVAVFGYVGFGGIPRTVSVIFPLLLFALVALNRIVVRFVLFDLQEAVPQRHRVLIYGAGRAGRQLALSLQHEGGYELLAYVDDDQNLIGQWLDGVPILTRDEMAELLDYREIELVFLAIPSLRRSERAKLVEQIRKFGAHVLTLPSVDEIVSGRVSVSDLREIQVVDLLARDPVDPDSDLLEHEIANQVVLVTGAGGSIGSELARQILLLRPKRLILFEMSEPSLFAIEQELRKSLELSGTETEIIPELGNLRNEATANRLMERWRPHIVFHAAAYKHVPLIEHNTVAGVENNVVGTLNAALAAQKHGISKFVLISTDKAVRPTNVMGASKRVCELILQALAGMGICTTTFSMVRFGNVLGSSGSVVPKFRKQIAEGGPITLTHREMTRYFMTIPEAAQLVIQAGAMSVGGEVFLLDMGDPVKIYDLAQAMISLAGRTVRDEANPDGDIEIVEIGLRPGEKLYEELLIGAEANSTKHDRIFHAREDSLAWPILQPHIEHIKSAASVGDAASIRKILSELVDGFEG
ncbi:polysaccharide biosynthesis protein [Tsuneonella flava]|uniref:Polysaccharide biosynthesis protein n=1 Tax=Tsuneonella flava TaxID=2055955 RepID=A0ABX7K9W8_9SPHN|nr:nucleoside-diphosphate sugar epimerase/dehydratase [Tsuneonella flava]QSB45030.1 polysaccharide biosynthesis protein [Tsuneonella flava]